MSLEERVEIVLRDFPAWESTQDDFATVGLWTVYRDTLPALALGFRLALDPQVTELVRELAETAPEARITRAREMAEWVPRGAGRRVVVELLLRAADKGRLQFTGSAAMCWFPEGTASPSDAKRRPKGTASVAERHDAYRSCAQMADVTVRLLHGDASGLQPPPRKRVEAHRQQLRSFLNEAAAHILKLGEYDGDDERPVPTSRARLRRAC